MWILGRHVDEHVSVDEDSACQSIPASSERHQFLGGLADMLQRAPEAAKRALGTSRLLPDRPQQHFPADELELDFGVGKQAGPFPDCLRNGDLTLARNAHSVLDVGNTQNGKNLTIPQRSPRTAP